MGYLTSVDRFQHGVLIEAGARPLAQLPATERQYW
jgi:hypothetical protein